MNRLDQQAEQDLARADVRDEARAAEFADRANGSPEPSIPAAKPEARAKILRFIPASEFPKPPTPPNWIVDGIAETDSFCEIGRAHVGTQVTNGHPVCRLRLAKKQQKKTMTQ